MASGLETSIERIVRLRLEESALHFTTQAQIGPWVVDFLIDDRLIIEADGSYWHTLRPHVDRRKTADLVDRGYVVWRISETEIRDDEFSIALQARLTDYEHIHGKITRLAPNQHVTVKNEDGVIIGHP